MGNLHRVRRGHPPDCHSGWATALGLAALLIGAAFVGPARGDVGGTPLVLTRSGDDFPAALERIEADWTLVLRADPQPRRVATKELVQWGAFRDSDRGSQIVLTDGSWLIGDVLQIADDRLQIDSDLWGRVDVSLAGVRGVVFNPSVDARVRDDVRRQIVAAEGTEDLLLLENGDVVAGTAQSIVEEEARDGAISVALAFVTRGREVQLPLNKITALVVNPSQGVRVIARGPRVLLGLADGTRLLVDKIERPGNLVRLTLVHGVLLTTDAPSFQEQVVYVQPLESGIVYVSDFEPAGYKHIPLLSQTLPLGRDRTSLGGELRVGGQLYAKGLGMPSASRAAYALRGRYQRFAAEVALADSSSPNGSAMFRVFLSDGKGGWQTAWESPPVRSGDAPRPMSVDTRGAPAMALIVDLGERGDVQDHAVWLNARLTEQE
ncbi:MAG: NPCBM/NEW2 domain-containing protein [Pirellulaceae bacterium]|nr:NPCBM/NEW2 domain-containing protein [Pirellulaceae bacterium]